jgi:hypothetical protein
MAVSVHRDRKVFRETSDRKDFKEFKASRESKELRETPGHRGLPEVGREICSDPTTFRI